MSHAEQRPWNRKLVQNRHSLEESLRMASEAERYLFLGRLLRARIRRGYRLADDARTIRLPLSECVAMMDYAGASSGVKLRALVEDWSWNTIKQRTDRSLPVDSDRKLQGA